MAFRTDSEKLKIVRRIAFAITVVGFVAYWVTSSVSVTPGFLLEKEKPVAKTAKKIVVDEVLKLPPPKVAETKVPRMARATLDRSIRPAMSSSLRGFGEGGAELDGTFSETGSGGVADKVQEAALDRQARVSRRVEPSFPQSARERGLSGTVTLELEVRASGQVGTVRLLESNPPGYFENSAIEAARKWTFEPAMSSGVPVASVVVQKVRFDLE